MTGPSRLRISRPVREALFAHARGGAPEEICGILAGRRNCTDEESSAASASSDDTAPSDVNATSDTTPSDCFDAVTAHHPIENVASRPRTRYELAPEETVETIERVEAAGDDVVGFYHSHPTGPLEPSETDRRQATWRGYVYAIVVPGEGIRVWRWTGEAFAEVAVRDGQNEG